MRFSFIFAILCINNRYGYNELNRIDAILMHIELNILNHYFADKN